MSSDTSPSIGARIALLALLERQRPGVWYEWSEFVAVMREGYVGDLLRAEVDHAMELYFEMGFVERRGPKDRTEVRITAKGLDGLVNLLRTAKQNGTPIHPSLAHLL